MKKKIILSFCYIMIINIFLLFAYETIRIATWNIEHLSGDGRGLGSIGSGTLPPHTKGDLKKS